MEDRKDVYVSHQWFAELNNDAFHASPSTDRCISSPSHSHAIGNDDVNVEGCSSPSKDPIGMARLRTSDVLEREFISVDDAEAFYFKYSFAVGFSVRKDLLRRDVNGLITRRRWVCSKQGFIQKKHADRQDRQRESKGITREGCNAAMRIQFDREKGLWVVKEFITEHCHALATRNQAQFLRSHREVPSGNIAQAEALKYVGVRTSQVMEHLVHQAGSRAAVGHTHKDLQNRLDIKRRSTMADGDADSVIAYMTGKKQMDGNFYFKYTVCQDGSLGNIFWADSQSRLDYQCFGDVVSFDSTYKTNAYNRPLVIFVGVNNHYRTTIFGFGLVVDETIATYTWVLKTFLEAMQQRHPVSVVTDGDVAMHKALKTVIPGATRRLCSWHLERNVQTNVCSVGFTRAFSNCMKTYMTEGDFEHYWTVMVSTYKLQGNDWVKKLYGRRKQWAESFLRTTFFGGMRSTQRSESINRLFNRYLNWRVKLFEFMGQTHRVMERIRYNEAKDNFQNMNSKPMLQTHLLQLEKHASEVYTRNLFIKVRDEINEEATLSIINCVVDMIKRTFTFKKFACGETTWDVVYSLTEKTFSCACNLFQTQGIPCCHIFSAMKAMNIDSLPDSLILHRWTKNAKDDAKFDTVVQDNEAKVVQMARYGALTSQCSKLCYLASRTAEGFAQVQCTIHQLTAKVEEVRADLLSNRYNPQGQKQLPLDVHLKDPAKAVTKGGVRKSKKTSAKTRHCGKCGKPGHTVKTCRHIQIEDISRIGSNYMVRATAGMAHIMSDANGGATEGVNAPAPNFRCPPNDPQCNFGIGSTNVEILVSTNNIRQNMPGQ